MRVFGLMATLLALLIGGFIYAKRLKTVPHGTAETSLLGRDGKPIEDMRELPSAVEKDMSEKFNNLSKKSTEAAEGGD